MIGNRAGGSSMNYRIIGDSCMDLTEEQRKDPHFTLIPFTLMVEDHQFIDDENFDQKRFLQIVKESPECPKTACHLSGCYNSAVLAKNLYEEEFGTGKKNIAVIDSESASTGEVNLALYIQELCEQDLPFDEIVKKALEYRDRQKTYFVLETLDTLRKNGRLTGLQAFFATKLNIKPVMGADHGVIIKLDQARGIQKALQRMVEIVVKEAGTTEDKRLTIAHCNAPERAQYVKEKFEQTAKFKEIIVTEMAGLATVYAGDGGIIAAV